MSVKFCTECGNQLAPDSVFCSECGTKVRGNSSFASAVGGEMTFTQAVPSLSGAVPEALGPVKYLLGGAGRLINGFKGAFKDKKKLIPAIVMALIWLVLTILPLLGVSSSPLRFLSFLTFAWGGIGTGVPGAIGGIIGKGIFAFFITTLVLPIFSGKKPFAGMGGGMKTLFGSFAVKDEKALVPLLAGGGAALIAYNFLTGNASLQNSMAGIAAVVLLLRSLSNKAGFLRGFLMSVVNKLSKRSAGDKTYINRIITGFTSGFALSVPLSAVRISFICYLAGFVVLMAAVIIGIVSVNKTEVAAG